MGFVIFYFCCPDYNKGTTSIAITNRIFSSYFVNGFEKCLPEFKFSKSALFEKNHHFFCGIESVKVVKLAFSFLFQISFPEFTVLFNKPDYKPAFWLQNPVCFIKCCLYVVQKTNCCHHHYYVKNLVLEWQFLGNSLNRHNISPAGKFQHIP